MPEFSVLLPVYAGDVAPHFARAVESVTVDQELRPAELVIVRDGPVGDDLEAVLLAAESGEMTAGVPVRVVRLEVNGGLAEALEVGLGESTHEIVARADADDVSLPARFARQVPLVEVDYDLLGSAITEFNDDESDLGDARELPLDSEEIARVARFRDPFNHPSVVYRKSAVARAGGYERLDKMEDYWLFVRMINHGARTGNLPESLVLYRVGQGAYKRRGGRRMLLSELGLQRRMLGAGYVSPLQAARNVVVRGGYRLIPTSVRERLYRSFVLGS
ncbi:MAG TPA: glycosyltransferase [Actinomycetaceae bacterium]|nr:glycosyltransferase [Actinomycetaceae bacterium]